MHTRRLRTAIANVVMLAVFVCFLGLALISCVALLAPVLGG